MWIRVLGSAAGGGFPQWNCHCPNCRGVRFGSLACQSQTQSSLAISADYRHWFLFNTSPDLHRQIEACEPLWPRNGVRDTPIQAVLFTDAELDHTLGVLMLREARHLRLYATAWVFAALHEWNPLLRTLASYCAVEWLPLRLDEATPLTHSDGTDSGLLCQAFATLSSKTVAFAPERTPHPEAVIGYRITDTRTHRSLVYVPALEAFSPSVRRSLANCTCLLIDGTFWDDDELARLGIGSKTARSMGHLPIAGIGGSLEQLAALDIDRIIYTHINNTNPLLTEHSPQRHAVEAHGIEVAFDGMEMEL
jgi:pyrroloquinoline quinone biosynthesis protein B